MLISALLGALGSVSVIAQTNVYSINTVGYMNVTLAPGLNIVTIPLLTSPDQTIETIFPNSSTLCTGSPFTGDEISFFSPSGYVTTQGRANAAGWFGGGGATNTIPPGTAVWYQRNNANPVTATVVGTVVSGLTTNPLVAGLNLVGSQVPLAGDLYSNAVAGNDGVHGFTNVNTAAGTGQNGDQVYLWDTNAQAFNPGPVAYQTRSPGSFNGSSPWLLHGSAIGDPVISNVFEGFFYEAVLPINWVENYSSTQP